MDQDLVIIGRNSYLGGYFTTYLRSRGVDALSLSSQECNFLDLSQVVRFFSGLRGDRARTLVFFAVINKSVANSHQSFLDNLQMVRNLVEGQKRASLASIVYFSSVDVYGAHPRLSITEDSQIAPDTWYGLTKYTCEWMLAYSGEIACPVTILRIPGIYGYAPNDRSVIGRMVDSIRREGKVFVNGSGNTLRDYVFVGDLCSVLAQLISRRYGGTLNVATGSSYSLLELVAILKEALNSDFEVTFRPPDRTREFDLRFDNSKLLQLLPNFLFSDLREGICSYLPIDQ